MTNTRKDVQDNYGGYKLTPGVTNTHPPEQLKLVRTDMTILSVGQDMEQHKPSLLVKTAGRNVI